jgi:hypothetical protein
MNLIAAKITSLWIANTCFDYNELVNYIKVSG